MRDVETPYSYAYICKYYTFSIAHAQRDYIIATLFCNTPPWEEILSRKYMKRNNLKSSFGFFLVLFWKKRFMCAAEYGCTAASAAIFHFLFFLETDGLQ